MVAAVTLGLADMRAVVTGLKNKVGRRNDRDAIERKARSMQPAVLWYLTVHVSLKRV